MIRLPYRVARNATVLVGAAAVLAGCASVNSVNPFAKADTRWADYKSWQTASEVPTTGPSPGLGNVHQGPDGVRVVYVNAAGAATLNGDGPYEYPEGTVLVKEQYASMADYDAGKTPDVTVSLKVANGPVARDNWQWADSLKSSAGDSAFCSGCHSIPLAEDFVFSNARYLAAN